MSGATLNILIPLYPGYNALDVNGPLDAFCNAALRPGNALPFQAFTASKDEEPVQAYEFIRTKADLTFREALDAIKEGKVDILLIPGGNTESVHKVIEDPPSEYSIQNVIKTFMSHDNKGSEKWIMTVCTGALLAGAAGVFKGRAATIHWAGLADLQNTCSQFDAEPSSIVRKRWVDGGSAPPISPAVKSTRIVSSGGISCGLDCSLWLIKQILGTQWAVDVAAVMDYAWNGGIHEVFRPSSNWAAIETGDLSEQWTTLQHS